MSVQKKTISTGEIRWEVRIRQNGRGSKMTCRRFEKKSQAEAFEKSFKEDKSIASSCGDSVQDFVGTTFHDEAQNWLTLRGIEFSPGYYKKVRGILLQLSPEIGHLAAIKITPNIVSSIQAKYIKSGRSSATTNRVLEVIKAILNFSVLQSRIPYNPSMKSRKLRVSKTNIDFWEESEASQFLAFARKKYPEGSKNDWIYLVYLLALNTGMRAGEIWGLQAGDCGRGDKMIQVRRQHDRIEKQSRPTKGSSERLVPCSGVLRVELQQRIASKTLGLSSFIFTNKKGAAVCHDNFNKRVFWRDLDESGIRPIRFHDLRHTAATLMIARGLNPPLVQKILGHESITTTMIYVHLVGKSLQDAADLFSVTPSPTLKLVECG